MFRLALGQIIRQNSFGFIGGNSQVEDKTVAASFKTLHKLQLESTGWNKSVNLYLFT